ncbi:MAG TPA: tetratricopeptide repeat protein [Acidimicrobiales bacterium]|nr:tetratricopeptide repeat protein [Acidimicrobiales bacterium]
MRGINRVRAQRLTRSGGRFLHMDLDSAELRYRKALRLDPSSHVAWFDLGLVCKWTQRWEEAFDCNLRATELIGEKRDEPAWWNLGIAATALHRWPAARRAWRVYGVDLPDGDGPIEADLGRAALRLNPTAEVVWGHRIDPARIRVACIPTPESGHRWGDVVLHDGEPRGRRAFDEGLRPVFDELARWAPSDVPTIQASVSAGRVAEVDELVTRLVEAGHEAEDWTRTLRMLCPDCSLADGSGHDHDHDGEPADDPDREHRLGIAGPLGPVTLILEAWRSDAPQRRCHDVAATEDGE